MTKTEVVTLITAIWGALTGTIALLFQYREHRLDRPVLRLNAHMSLSHDSGPLGTRLAFRIEAYNAGRRLIRITRAGVLMPKSHGILISEATESGPGGLALKERVLVMFDAETAGNAVTLEEGQSFSFDLDPFPIERAKLLSEREQAFVEDASGRRHTAFFNTIRSVPSFSEHEQPTKQL